MVEKEHLSSDEQNQTKEQVAERSREARDRRYISIQNLAQPPFHPIASPQRVTPTRVCRPTVRSRNASPQKRVITRHHHTFTLFLSHNAPDGCLPIACRCSSAGASKMMLSALNQSFDSGGTDPAPQSDPPSDLLPAPVNQPATLASGGNGGNKEGKKAASGGRGRAMSSVGPSSRQEIRERRTSDMSRVSSESRASCESRVSCDRVSCDRVSCESRVSCGSRASRESSGGRADPESRASTENGEARTSTDSDGSADEVDGGISAGDVGRRCGPAAAAAGTITGAAVGSAAASDAPTPAATPRSRQLLGTKARAEHGVRVSGEGARGRRAEQSFAPRKVGGVGGQPQASPRTAQPPAASQLPTVAQPPAAAAQPPAAALPPATAQPPAAALAAAPAPTAAAASAGSGAISVTTSNVTSRGGGARPLTKRDGVESRAHSGAARAVSPRARTTSMAPAAAPVGKPKIRSSCDLPCAVATAPAGSPSAAPSAALVRPRIRRKSDTEVKYSSRASQPAGTGVLID